MSESLVPVQTAPEAICPPEAGRFARLRSRAIKFGKCALAYTTFIGSYNAIQYIDTFYFEGNRDDIEMIEDATLCEPFDYVETEISTGLPIAPKGFTPKQAEQTLTTERKYAEVRSAARHLKPAGVFPHKFLEQFVSINRHEFDSFTSIYSGANIHLYSDTDDAFSQVDKAAIDELVHSSLDENLTFDHITVSQFMECARDQILLSRGGSLLKDHRINLYIASQPGVCWSNGHIQTLPQDPEVTYRDFCDSVGATVKDLKFDFIPGILAYEQTWLTVMSSRHDPVDAQSQVSRGILHEPIHLWQQALGLPFKYDPNERLADYIEAKVRLQRYDNDLPVAVQY